MRLNLERKALSLRLAHYVLGTDYLHVIDLSVVLVFCYFSNNRIPPSGAAIIAKVLPANDSLQILKVYSMTTLESHTQSEKTTETPCGFYSEYETTYFGGQFNTVRPVYTVAMEPVLYWFL